MTEIESKIEKRKAYQRAYQRSYRKNWTAQNRARGFCRCGRERVGNRSQCAACLKQSARDNLIKKENRKQRGVCRLCGRESNQKTRCERCKETARRYLQRLKEETIAAYGGKCECCGEMLLAFLTIDHINNDGFLHRQQTNHRKLYPWLKQKGFPGDRFRCLCFNCNCGRHVNGGHCPHTTP